MYKAFLIKYGEIGTKGKNRYIFEDMLDHQIRHALKKVIYKEVGDREHSQSMAQLIIEKPIKVRSSMIRQIKYKVKQELQ